MNTTSSEGVLVAMVVLPTGPDDRTSCPTESTSDV